MAARTSIGVLDQGPYWEALGQFLVAWKDLDPDMDTRIKNAIQP